MNRLKDSHQMSRTLRLGESQSDKNSWRRLQVWVQRDSVTFIRTYGGYWEKAVEVSSDLLTLAVLFVGNLVPAGVLADKIDDEFGSALDWVSEYLRLWDTAEVES